MSAMAEELPQWSRVVPPKPWMVPRHQSSPGHLPDDSWWQSDTIRRETWHKTCSFVPADPPQPRFAVCSYIILWCTPSGITYNRTSTLQNGWCSWKSENISLPLQYIGKDSKCNQTRCSSSDGLPMVGCQEVQGGAVGWGWPGYRWNADLRGSLESGKFS